MPACGFFMQHKRVVHSRHFAFRLLNAAEMILVSLTFGGVTADQCTRPVSEVTAVSHSRADGHAKQHLGPAHKHIPTAPLTQPE